MSKDWIVMAGVDSAKNNGSSFTSNAVDLTEEEAVAEAKRRNAVEKADGHKGIDWFPAENPMATLARMGFKL